MAVNLSPLGGVGAQFFDNSGNPLTGGKIYTYAAGTTTSQATYTSSSGSTAHSNPIILDAAGRVPGGEIWLTDGLQYKFVLKTSTDTSIATYDNIVGINSNFVNYTNQQEIQTATAGQTVFTLTTMQYQPGTNSLSVFVDGVNQYGSGAQYAFVETDSTTVTFVSGLHVGAQVKFSTAAINAASYGDAFQISYTPPFTASVATNVGDKLAQYISVKDFGAVGDGVTDDSSAIQAAINAAQGSPVYFPAGTYILESSLELNFSSAVSPTYQPATRLVGAGPQVVTLVNRSGNAAIKNTPTLAQTQELIGIRFFGGVLTGFTITTDNLSSSNSSGIELASYWFATLANLTITQVDGVGISVPEIPAFGANSDKYSCGSLIVDNCLIDANDGWGIASDIYSITWIIKNCYLSNNTQGAIYSLGAGHQITDNAIAGNGNSGVSSIGGIHLTTTGSAAAPENVLIRDNEFDNNWGSHIYHEGFNSIIEQNRFIQSGTAGTGGTTFRNAALVYLDATNTSACFNNIIRNNSIRFDDATTQVTQGFVVENATGAYNNAIIDNTWSPSSYANNPAYVTKYYLPAARERLYATEKGIQIAGSNQVAYVYRQVVVTYVGNTVSHTSTPSQIKLVGLYNPNINNTFTFDDATWTFTVPYSGVLKITSNLIYTPTLSAVNSAANIFVYKNGSAYHTQKIPQGFQVASTEQGYTFDVTMLVAVGDTINLYADVAAGILYSTSNLTATTTFEML
jgi:hypothetical protein